MQPLPVAHPVLKNLILVGNGSAASKQGIRLRRRHGSGNRRRQGLRQEANAVTLETALTENALQERHFQARPTSPSTSELSSAEEGIYTHADFVSAVTSNTVDTSLNYTSFDDIKSRVRAGWPVTG